MDHEARILFGLGGTLTDPKEGTTKSVCYALNHYGIQVEDLGSLCPFIEPPLTDSCKKFYGFSNRQAWEDVLIYREYFGGQGWYENREYPGIREMLQALKGTDKTLLVATSKPGKFAVKILEHFKLAEYFDSIDGTNLDETRCRKGDMIRYVLESSGLGPQREAADNAVMMGSRKHGVLGARECGMECVGVLYGYGSRQEMEDCRAAHVVEAVSELGQFFLSL